MRHPRHHRLWPPRDSWSSRFPDRVALQGTSVAATHLAAAHARRVEPERLDRGRCRLLAVFLLTLYMQQVAGYSAIKTGVAYIGVTLTTIALSAVAQGLVTRFGVRRVLPVGLALSAVALVLFAQPAGWRPLLLRLVPGLHHQRLGLALAFVPMAIGALTGVREADAGIASGLINTTQQIGAIGVAATTTVAITFTDRYVDSHAGISALSGPAPRMASKSRSTSSRPPPRSVPCSRHC